MKFSIHQPNYIPWIGFFYKILRSDVFVYLDAVQYPRGQSFGARNAIKTPNGQLFLTIPVTVEKGKEGKVTYLDIQYSDPKWKTKHLRTLEANYKKAPYFTEIYALIQSVFAQDVSFSENNIQLIEAICNYLSIDTRRVRLSQLLADFGNKTDLIIDIANAVNAKTYLCGDGGGTEYTDENLLGNNQIKLDFTHFNHPVYKQLWGDPFISHLSVVDLLFNTGRDAINIIAAYNDKQVMVHEDHVAVHS